MSDQNDTVLDGPERLRPFNESAGAVREQGMMDVAISRAAQEVQASMVVAKKFPRDEEKAFARIMKACQRRALAEDAVYSFPRGGQTVSGPSIRMAEVLAQNWGNIDFGIIELDQKDGQSTMMSYALDYETNTKSTKIFTVKHIREKRGGNVTLTDPRDIYEMTANQGARRLRACILAVIPGDIVDSAVKACDETLAKGGTGPIIDRIRAMLVKFEGIGVNKEMIEKRIGHKIDTMTESEVVIMGKIYKSITDNMASKDQYFESIPAGAQEAKKPEPSKTAAAKPVETKAPVVPAVVFDATKPAEEIARLCKEAEVTEAQLLVWAKEQKLAGKVIEEVRQMSDAKLVNILSNWNGILPEVKKIVIE